MRSPHSTPCPHPFLLCLLTSVALLSVALLLATPLLAAPLAANPGGAGAPTLPFDLSPVESWSRLDAAATVPYGAEGIRSDLLASFRSPAGSYLFVTRTNNTLQIPAFTAAGLSDMFEAGFFADLEPRDFEATVVTQRHGRHGTLRWMINTFLADAMPYDAGNGDGPVLARGAFLPLVVWHPERGHYDNLMYAVNFRGAPDAADDLAAFRRVWHSFELPPDQEVVAAERFNALRPELLRRRERRADAAPPAPEATDRPAAPEDSLLALLERAGRSVSAGPVPGTAAYPDTVVGRVMAELAVRARRSRAQQVWETAFAEAPEARKARLAALFLGESLREGHLELARHVVDTARRAGVGGSALACAEPLYLLNALAAAGSGGGADLLPLGEALECSSFANLMTARLDPLPADDLLGRRSADTGTLRRQRQGEPLPRLARDGARWLAVHRVPATRRRVHLEPVTDLLDLAPLLARQ